MTGSGTSLGAVAHRRKPLAALAWILLVGMAGPTFAMRCDGHLIDAGDWPIEVREACGEPDYVARYPQAAIAGLGYIQTLEHWYYNPGPQRLLRRLIFTNGKLRRVETLGFGFVEPRLGCAATQLHEGMSEYELYARCGAPLSERQWHLVRPLGHRGLGGYEVTPVEEWLYDFGQSRFRRVVRLENGRVTGIATADKPQ